MNFAAMDVSRAPHKVKTVSGGNLRADSPIFGKDTRREVVTSKTPVWCRNGVSRAVWGSLMLASVIRGEATFLDKPVFFW